MSSRSNIVSFSIRDLELTVTDPVSGESYICGANVTYDVSISTSFLPDNYHSGYGWSPGEDSLDVDGVEVTELEIFISPEDVQSGTVQVSLGDAISDLHGVIEIKPRREHILAARMAFDPNWPDFQRQVEQDQTQPDYYGD